MGHWKDAWLCLADHVLIRNMVVPPSLSPSHDECRKGHQMATLVDVSDIVSRTFYGRWLLCFLAISGKVPL